MRKYITVTILSFLVMLVCYVGYLRVSSCLPITNQPEDVVVETKQIDPRTACVIITNGWGHGSGVHLGRGIILTAGHCVDINDAWIIANDGRTYTIIDKWKDPYDEDIGFVRVRNWNLPFLELGDMPEVMQDVRVIGNPLNLAMSFNVTKGIVSRLHTDFNGWWYDTMLIDADIFPGNSGGPVLNMQNQIVGIVVGTSSYQNLSICEPVENIRWSLRTYLLEQIENGKI